MQRGMELGQKWLGSFFWQDTKRGKPAGFGLRHACIVILPLTATHPLPPNLVFPYQQMGLKMPACQIGMRRRSARVVAACDMWVIVTAAVGAK